MSHHMRPSKWGSARVPEKTLQNTLFPRMLKRWSVDGAARWTVGSGALEEGHLENAW